MARVTLHSRVIPADRFFENLDGLFHFWTDVGEASSAGRIISGCIRVRVAFVSVRLL